MPEDTATPSPMEMAPPPNTRLLKAIVIGMGLLLVVGFAVVVATIITRASHPTASSLAGLGGRFGISDIHIDPGEKVRSITMTDERLAIQLGSDKPGGSGGEEIVIVNAKTGVELGRIRLRPLSDFAETGAAR